MLAAGPGPHQDWLAVHGLLDNAGSWGRLAPLLPPGIRLTCLELPGHGRSDHLPPGGLYHWLELTLLLERARAALSLHRPVLLAHSMGAWLAGLYAALWPHRVRALIQLDGVKPISRQPAGMVDRVREFFTNLDKLENSPRPDRPMTEAEAVERVMRGSNALHGKDSLTRAGAGWLADRGVRQTAAGLVFSRDPRLLLRDLHGMPHQYNTQFAASIVCPHLLVPRAL